MNAAEVLLPAVAPASMPFVSVTRCLTAASLHEALCFVKDCGWTYGPSGKTDVRERATWHRKAHRAAAGAEQPDVVGGAL